MSELPSRPWQKLSCDFYGPLPNGHQYLVIMDDFSRFPVVEEVSSTASKFGIPKVLKSDNGPPFNGFEIGKFAQYLGFRHQKITPELPRANGTAERFMTSIKRVVREATKDKKCVNQELNSFLRSYRATPHASTGEPPSVLLYGRSNTTRLPQEAGDEKLLSKAYLKKVRDADADAKAKGKAKAYADKRNRAQVTLKVGQQVYIRRKTPRKHETRFDPSPCVVLSVKGAMITVQLKNGKMFTRNSSGQYHRVSRPRRGLMGP